MLDQVIFIFGNDQLRKFILSLQTNTFQMILATDEVYTYAIFNYAIINWSSHTEAGGDTTGGEGGVPAYVGSFAYSEISKI